MKKGTQIKQEGSLEQNIILYFDSLVRYAKAKKYKVIESRFIALNYDQRTQCLTYLAGQLHANGYDGSYYGCVKKALERCIAVIY